MANGDLVNSKVWWKSKTVWLNVITTLLAVFSLSATGSFIPVKYIALIVGIGNIILRVWFTSQPVSFG